GRIEGMPELLHDFATAFAEDLREPAALLMAKRIILANGSDPLVALFTRPVAKGMSKGACRIAGNPDHVFDAVALGEIIGGDDRNKIGRAGSFDVIGDREPGIG